MPYGTTSRARGTRWNFPGIFPKPGAYLSLADDGRCIHDGFGQGPAPIPGGHAGLPGPPRSGRGWRSSPPGGVPPLRRPGGGGVDPPRLAEPPPHRGGPPPGGGDGGAGLGTHHFRPTARGLCHRPRRGTPGDLWGGGGPGRGPPVLPAHHLPGPPGAPHHEGGLPAPFCPGSTRGAGAQHPHPLPAGLGKTTLLRDLIRCLFLGRGRRPAGWGGR